MPRPGGRRWAGALRGAAASSGIALALAVALEGGLRLAGIGAPGAGGASRLPYQHLVQPALRPGRQADGTEVLVPADPRLPYQAIRRRKPDDALRVIVFGGSAAAGLGYSPNVTFARHLERMLGEALPERPVEVLNLAITALSSTQVVELVREACARYEPDVLVVYSGNNEFLELHARKYVLAHAGPAERLGEALRETHLARLVEGLAGPRRPSTLAELRAGEAKLRLTQTEIIEDIALAPGEHEAVVDRYAANLAALVELAAAASTPLVLMTVASNWTWRGIDDLPAGWKAELAPGGADADVLAALDAKLADERDPERHAWLFRRATLLAELDRHDEARRDYRAAMNADPRLRRALDAMNERVRALGREPGVRVLDTVERLARSAPHGTVGFADLYDYVHFTPEGAARVGALLYEAVAELAGETAEDARARAARYLADELARLDALTEDPLERGRWLGVGLDLARVEDRDLWKYERMLEDLEAALAANPDDVRALVYRGNARSFRLGGAEGALADWARALERAELPAVRANVERLRRERDVSRP